MNEYIIGVDVGSSKICAAAGKYDKQGKLQIAGITTSTCNGTIKGEIVDVEKTIESIKNALDQLEKIIYNKITCVYVSISSGQCEIIKNKGVINKSSNDNMINSNDMEKVRKYASTITIPKNKEIIGIIPNQYILDGIGGIKDPIGMSGCKLELEADIFVTTSAILDNLFMCFKRLEIEICGLAIQPLVSSQVVLREEELSNDTLILDIGSDTTDISILKNGKISYSSILPLGGNNITNDICICLKLKFAQAENLKFKYGSIVSEEENYKIKIKDDNVPIEIDFNLLTDIIKARIEEILNITKEIIDKSELSESYSSIVIVGGGISYFKGIGELCKNIFNKPTRIGIPNFIGAANPIYANAVGIVNDVYLNTKPNVKVNEESDTIDVMVENENKTENISENSLISKLKNFFTDFF